MGQDGHNVNQDGPGVAKGQEDQGEIIELWLSWLHIFPVWLVCLGAPVFFKTALLDNMFRNNLLSYNCFLYMFFETAFYWTIVSCVYFVNTTVIVDLFLTYLSLRQPTIVSCAYPAVLNSEARKRSKIRKNNFFVLSSVLLPYPVYFSSGTQFFEIDCCMSQH